MERSVRAILRAETGQYEAGMGRAAKATEQVGTAAETASRKTRQSTQEQTTAARSFSQRLVSSARENEQAWTRVGGALTVAGGATSALMGTVLHTGISYNQLRQQSLAALTTLTGSAEDANAQMDKLDDFASNSPFARDVFIRAQQQMLGFGIEAGKVVPYLDAIQNAVAAAGGSNHDIAELSRIFSQISASAKITGTDLREFGNRGVDAATIIGSQMGMTGAQVRDAITEGSIDAGDALDALAAGMSETYDGAAANVKNTFDGATDRVRAAIRDISSIVAEPLVGREGGGLLTGFLNQIADVLRLVEDLPDPVLQAGGALVSLGGMATLGAGGFMMLVPRLVDTWDALGQLGSVGPRAQGVLRNMAPTVGRIAGYGAALGVTAVAAGALMKALHERGAARNAEDVAEALTVMARAGEDLAAADLGTVMDEMSRLDLGFFEVSTIQAENLGEALQTVADPSITDNMSRFIGTISGLPSYMKDYDDVIDSLGAGFTHLATTDLPEAQRAFENLATSMQITTDQGAIELIDQIPGLRDALVGIAEDAGLATDDTTLLALAMGWVVPEAQALGGAQEEMSAEFDSATSAIEAQEEALQELIDTYAEHFDAVLSERAALRDLEAAFDAATESVKDNGATLDTNTEAGRANESALDDIAASAHTVTDRMRAMNRPTVEIAEVMDRARGEFIEAATAMGMAEDDAKALATELGLLPRDVFIDVEARMNATAQIQTFKERWNGVSIATAWVDIMARDNLSRGMAASGARYTAQARAYYGGYVGGPVGSVKHRQVEYRSYGGPVFGPGTGTSDSVPAIGPGNTPYRLSNGEHIWTAAETAAVGGHAAMESLRVLAATGRLRAALDGPGYATGGGIDGLGSAVSPQALHRLPAPAQVPSGRGLQITVQNHYPQAEPTSVTVNRAQQYAAAIGEL